jgi:hypothetical protein
LCLLYAVNSANDPKRFNEYAANGGDIIVAMNGGNIYRLQWEASGVKAGVDSVNVVHFGLFKSFVLKKN